MARILIVEDDPDLRRLLVVWLDRTGHQARAVADASAAREALAEPWDLVLCDVDLGAGDSGLDLYAWAQARGLAGPFAFLTGGGVGAEATGILNELGDRVCGKPMRLPELGRHISRWLRPT